MQQIISDKSGREMDKLLETNRNRARQIILSCMEKKIKHTVFPGSKINLQF